MSEDEGNAPGNSHGDHDGAVRQALRTEELCLALVDAVDLTGAAVAMITESGERNLLYATNTVVAQLDELQFGLGEGPCLDAYRARRPVLADDLGAAATAGIWPMFARESVRVGAAAAFAYPLLAGTVCFGVLELYRDRPGVLPQDRRDRVVVAVELLSRVALDELFGEVAERNDDAPGRISAAHARVHQAAGMLAVQLGLSVPDAMARLRAAAYTRQLPLPELAQQVLMGRAHLERDTQ